MLGHAERNTGGRHADATHRPILSILAIGATALLLVSLGIPYFTPPFEATAYFLWLPLLIIVMGAASALRHEQGPVARAGQISAIWAFGLLVIPRVLGFVIGAILGLLGYD
jgi:hypothetical protein